MSWYERKISPPDQQIALARQSAPYGRLRVKFETAGVSEGLKPNDLVIGDVHDTALLYAGLVRGTRGVEGGFEKLLNGMQDLAWVFEQTLEEAPDSLKRSFAGRFGRSTLVEELDTLDRSGPLFDLPVDLEKLMDNPFSPKGVGFEIAHYPGGLLVMRNMMDWKTFVLKLQNLNGNEPKFYGEVFRETGLPAS